MNRRSAISSIAATPLLAADNPPKQQYYELRYYQLRNGVPNAMPTSKPAGLHGPYGAFSAFIAENSPFLLNLFTYESFADAEANADSASGYIRYERTILKAFTGHPELKLPPASKSGRIFEIRTYESNTGATLKKKIEMFNNGEMQIFQRLGMNPVFFGEAIVGSKLPHLTYMLAFDDLAHRDSAWKAFGADPEWLKLRATPGLSDADIVSNISNMLVRPTAISDIR
jgi:hypothetical protein